MDLPSKIKQGDLAVRDYLLDLGWHCPGPPAEFARPKRFPEQVGFGWRVCVGAQGG